MQATAVTGFVTGVNNLYVPALNISFLVIVVNLILLILPHIYELYFYSKSALRLQKIVGDKNLSKDDLKTKMSKEDLSATIDYILDMKEMFIRIVTLWVSLGLMVGVILVLKYFNVPVILINIVCIIIFSAIHYAFDRMSLKERAKIFDSYQAAKLKI